MYMKDWNEVVEVVEGFTSDVLDYLHYQDDYDQAFSDLSKDIAFYTLLVLNKFSR